MIKKMKTVSVVIILLFTKFAYANDKVRYCPSTNQIHFNDSRLFAYNSEKKPFSSGLPCSFCDDINDIKVLSFQPQLTKYNVNDKTLSCTYDVEVNYRVGGVKNELKILINRGDY